MKSSFIGHIAGILINDKLIEFTTYNGTKVNKCHIFIDKVEIEMENSSHLLKIIAYREKSTTLAAPISGFMDGRIDESMKASIEVNLFDKKKKIVLLNDIGKSAGIEVAGKYEMLVK